MRGFVVAWVGVVALPGVLLAGEPFAGRFAIEGVDSAGVRYAGTLELRGGEVRRRVRLGDRWVEHQGRGELRGDDAVLRLAGELSPTRAEAAGMSGALGGDAAPEGPGGTVALRLTVWRAEGRVEARLERPGWAAEERGRLEARHDLDREVRSELPDQARLRLSLGVQSGGAHLEEEVVLVHRQAGGEVRRSYERLTSGGEEHDLRGVTERLRPAGPSWESGYELLERTGGGWAARRRLERSNLARSLLVNAPARVFFAPHPVAVGESWSLEPDAVRAVYKVDRLDPAGRSRAAARLVAVAESEDGPRYRISVRVELAVRSIQGLELAPGTTFQVTHELTQSRTRHEFVSEGRLVGRQAGGGALDERLRSRFEVLSLGAR